MSALPIEKPLRARGGFFTRFLLREKTVGAFLLCGSLRVWNAEVSNRR